MALFNHSLHPFQLCKEVLSVQFTKILADIDRSHAMQCQFNLNEYIVLHLYFCQILETASTHQFLKLLSATHDRSTSVDVITDINATQKH